MRTRRPPMLTRLTQAVVAMVTGALVLSGCSIYDVPLPGGANPGDNPIHLKLLFRNVLDLVPQSTVKVNDVTVGKVSSIKLRGYVAEVDVVVPRNADLPENTVATIRQTSLLGEKFVSLAAPAQSSSKKIHDGQTIGLDSTGRNPEVEEVLGALSLLLNGGGVGQLKTISEQLNLALGGRESDVRSVLEQIRTFVGQLDANKESIVAAIDNVNRLALQIRQQDGTIKSALDNIPQALASINRQRGDLVKLLQSLSRLSDVGVRVIQASKASTINTLRDLSPVLNSFAAAGQNFPKSFQVLLTYPFVDAAVGNDPQVARNLHMGDFTNLSARLDLNLLNLPTLPELPGLPGPVCDALDQVLAQTRANVNRAIDRGVDALPDTPLITRREKQRLRQALRSQILGPALDQARQQCRAVNVSNLANTVTNLLPNLLKTLQILTPRQVNQLINGTLGQVGGALGGLGGTNPLPGLPLPGLGRAAPGPAFSKTVESDPFGLGSRGIDPNIGTMLLQGVATTR